MESFILSDDETWYNLYDETSFTQGQSLIIFNNSNNEVYVARSTSQPAEDDGIPLELSTDMFVTGKVGENVWVKGAKGSIIVQRTVDQISPEKTVDLPADCWTSKNPKTRRLQVDVAETGFEEGREFRINYPLSIATTNRVVLKFSSPVDFRIQLQTLSSDTAGILFKAYRQEQGVESGVFGTNVPVYDVNFEANTPPYTRQVTVTTGGDFTPNGGEEAVETIRLRVANASGQATTVGGDVGRQRGIGAGDYYLVFTNLVATGTATGVYSLEFEERPSQFT